MNFISLKQLQGYTERQVISKNSVKWYKNCQEWLTLTGKVPGNAASKADTWQLTGAANFVAEPENSFEHAEILAWISKPMTGFHWLQKCQFIH